MPNLVVFMNKADALDDPELLELVESEVSAPSLSLRSIDDSMMILFNESYSCSPRAC